MARRSGRLLRAVSTAGIAMVTAALATPAAAGAGAASPSAGDPASVLVEPAAASSAADHAARLVAEMSTAERAGTVVMGHIATTDPATAREYVADAGLAGLILMGDDIPATETALRGYTTAITADAALPPLIAVDQEGGDVTRLPWDGFAAAPQLRDLPAEETAAAFAARGALVARAGITVNFGIVADITADPGSFIFRRALGGDGASGADRVAAAVEGEAPFAASTLKHFPGHGAAPGDSHATIPATALSLGEWRSDERLPFAAGVDAGAPLVMFGHLAYTAVDDAPASLSSRWHEILRDDLGFEGVAVTDDLGMLQASGVDAYSDPVTNAVAAIAAGNDLVLVVVGATPGTAPAMADGIASAVESGDLDAARLGEAATRVVALRLELAARGAALAPCGSCAPAG